MSDATMQLISGNTHYAKTVQAWYYFRAVY